MAEVFFWCDVVADELFELLHFREAALLFAVPNNGVVYGDDVDSACVRRSEGDGLEVFLKCCEEFLSVPCGAKEPTAAGAIFDGNGWFHCWVMVCLCWLDQA